MTKTLWLKVAGAVAITSLATVAIAADHRDGPGVQVDPSTDINDVYSFMDNGRVALVMTVLPVAVSDSKFSDKVQYIFHTTSGASFNEATAHLDIVCTFDAKQEITCLAGEGPGKPVLDKVTGDASKDAGLDSELGKMKVFAGLRKDPFFFNLDGFNDVVSTVKMVAGTLMFDGAGCPKLDVATSTLLANKLKSDPAMPGAPAKDFFADLNTLSIVLSLDKTLMTAGGAIVSVYGSTHSTM